MDDKNTLTQNEVTENKKLSLTEADMSLLLEEVEKSAIIETIETVHHSEQFQGPIPHPEHMQQYKDIDLELPNRIISMAESNLDHKQSIEKIEIYGQLFMGFLGWLTPSGIAFYVLYHAVIFTKEGKSIEALIALITAIAALGGAFYMKSKTKSSDKEE